MILSQQETQEKIATLEAMTFAINRVLRHKIETQS